MKVCEKKKLIVYGCLFIFGMVFLMFLSRETGYYLQNDSKGYIELGNRHGVMPLYPLFLYLLRSIFGVERYLFCAVIIQTLFAICSSVILLDYLCETFVLNTIECVVCYFGLLLLFNIDYIFSGITHQILTEGLAYPVFYIYILFLLKSINDKWLPNTVVHSLLACILSLIRSQMKMMIVLSAVVALYYWAKRWIVEKDVKHLGRAVISSLGVVVLTLLICAGADRILQNLTGSIVAKNVIQSEQSADTPQTLDAPVKHSINQAFDLFDGKILYTAQKDDVQLFDNDEIKELYSIMYQAMEENECLPRYAQTGLNRWRSMLAFNNCAKVCREAYEQYQSGDEDVIIYTDAMNIILPTLARKHWPMMIKHMSVFFSHGLMCSVCFENEEHLALCYIVTVLSLICAVCTIALRLRQKDSDKKDIEIFILIIVLMLMLNAMVSIPLFTIRRYVCYFIGIYYAMLFICVRNWAVNAGIIKRK